MRLVYSLICWLSFLAVFAYTVGWLGGFLVPTLIDGDGALWPALAIDLALLAAFAIPHSVMARPAFKRAWTRIVPESAERSTFVLQATLFLALAVWQWRPIGGAIWSVEAPWARGLVWAAFGLAWALTVASTFAIDHFEFVGLKRPGHATFHTPWLYRIVRHPMMLGLTAGTWITPRLTVGHLVFAAGMTLYALVGIRFEERDLERTLGDDYRSYRARVPMLLPWPRPRQR